MMREQLDLRVYDDLSAYASIYAAADCRIAMYHARQQWEDGNQYARWGYYGSAARCDNEGQLLTVDALTAFLKWVVSP